MYLVISEVCDLLTEEGFKNANRHVLRHGFKVGYLPKPRIDGGGRMQFTKQDIRNCRRYLKNVPSRGRKKLNATA